MKVTAETVGTREVALTIEPDPERVQRALRRAAREICRWRPVPGFRPGRAPYALVERMVGRELVLNQAINEMAPDLYRQAIEEADIDPYEQGQLEVESENPVVLKVNIPLMPIVELGDYRSLRIDPEPEVSITEEQIDQQVELVRRQHAEYEPVERPLQVDDQIVATLVGTSEEERVVDEEDVTFNVGEDMQPPGFAEALLGMRDGETREFALTYPEDFENEDLAGKQVDFRVSVTTIREAHLPEIDDDLAKMAGDYETVDEMREGLATILKQRLEREARQREADAAIQALIEQATVEYPLVALNREMDTIVEGQRSRLQRMGFEYENYLRMMGLTAQEHREQIRPEAEQRLIRRLVLTEFARAESLSVEASELDDQMAEVSSGFGDRTQEVAEWMREDRVRLSMYAAILGQKAIEHLTAMFTGRMEEAGPETASDQRGETAEGEEPKESDEAAASDDAEESEADA